MLRRHRSMACAVLLMLLPGSPLLRQSASVQEASFRVGYGIKDYTYLPSGKEEL